MRCYKVTDGVSSSVALAGAAGCGNITRCRPPTPHYANAPDEDKSIARQLLHYKTGARALKRKRVHNGLALRVLQVVFAECRRRWSDRSCWHLQKKKKKKKAYSSPLWALNASQVAFHQKFASSDNSVALHFDRKCLTNGRWEREKREKEKVRKMKSNLLKEHLPYIISSEWLLSGSMSSMAGGSVVERKKKTLMWKKESTGSFIYWLFKGNFGAPLTGMIKWIFLYSAISK